MHAPPLVNGTGAERMPCVEERLITTNVAWPTDGTARMGGGELYVWEPGKHH